MRSRAIVNAVLVCAVVGGGLIVAETVQGTGSAPPSPAASAAHKLPPSSASPPPPPPVDIPPGIPSTLAVQTPTGMLIEPTPVDQTLLKVRSDGAVVPGQEPGLYVADKISTLPGTHQGTVVIGGHAKADHDMVFNPLTKIGRDDFGKSQVILQMPQGKLTYVIEATYLVNKVDLPQQHALADNRPGRLELITCDVEGSNDTFQNLIVVACDASHQGCASV
ncbi:MAG: hypothetical protein H6797_05415 [Candidatus Nomurabacteria bacterium]|nr:MAG: hypothetical protein H6797_05415 [Candidatus Nomurabacteria bacterium]